jgi:hypothetical protein
MASDVVQILADELDFNVINLSVDLIAIGDMFTSCIFELISRIRADVYNIYSFEPRDSA